MNKLDKILILVFSTALIFTITMIVIFCKFQSIPDSLVVAVFGALFGEISVCGWIKNVKEKKKGDDEE